MTLRVPTTTWLKMSWPRWVVPNQCAPEGPCSRSLLRADGSYGAIQSPMTAITRKKTMTARPVTVLPPVRNRKRRRRATASSGRGWTALTSAAGTAMSALLPGARVEREVRDVGDQVRHQHRERDDQED